ncbi:DUF4352 domain-containing protein [Cryptosporangium japonicum]|uniref:DUF4352 domain-containing protein n=1 Tax=Cryptosporangium japonicum TaxID=80872 RepID=A0ABN0V4Q7_9ACTN
MSFPHDPYGGQPQHPYGTPPPYGPPPGAAPYGPPPYGAPPGYGPPPPKKSNGGVIAIGVGVALLAVCLVCGIAGAIYLANRGGSETTAGSDRAPTGRLNQPVKDGDLEWTVKSGECGATSIGSVKAAQQFCVYQVTVTNTGRASVPRGLGFHEAYGAGGEKYEFNLLASTTATENDPREFAPGATANLSLVFEVPTGATPTTIRLRDSTRADGVSVTVR